MATVTINIKRQNGVNISATSTDIDDEAVIEIAMMLGALVFDATASPLSVVEPEEDPPLPVPLPDYVREFEENRPMVPDMP